MPNLRHPERITAAAACLALAASTTPVRAQWTAISLHLPGFPGNTFGAGGSGSRQVGYAAFSPEPQEGVGYTWSGSAASAVRFAPLPTFNRAVLHAISGRQRVGRALFVFLDPDPLRVGAALWNSDAAIDAVILYDDLASGDYSAALATDGVQQVGTLNNQFALLWSGTPESMVILNPPGTNAIAYGVDAGQQVGALNGHAALWSGTPESHVDLHPAGYAQSFGIGICAGEQCGDVGNVMLEAALWRGSAASFVNLHIPGTDGTSAASVCHGEQVGYAQYGLDTRAIIWAGTAESWESLHAFLPSHFTSSFARFIWKDAANTYVTGWAFNSTTGFNEAVLWTRPTNACPGDVSRNGNVGLDDLAAIITCWTLSANCNPAADQDSSGDIGLGDIAAVIARWGQSCQ